MGVHRRPAAAASAKTKHAGDPSTSKTPQKHPSTGGKAKAAPQPEVVPATVSTLRTVVAAAALALGLASAFREWPIYL